MSAIQVQNLSKSFGEIQAVRDVSFDVQTGEISSLPGPNGAGKTATLAMLSKLLRPDHGDAFELGNSIRERPMEVKKALGVVPQEIASPVFQVIGRLTPLAWTLDGFKNITIRGLGIPSALQPAAVLLAYGGFFFGLAAWRFNRMKE